VAPSHNIALLSYYANIDLLASWRGSETQIEIFYEFKRRKEEFVIVL